MTEKRKQKIKQEAERRVSEWLKHSDFDTMSTFGSQLKFDMSLGLFQGYPFDEPEWMVGLGFNGFITEKEFYTEWYDEMIDNLFFLTMMDNIIKHTT